MTGGSQGANHTAAGSKLNAECEEALIALEVLEIRSGARTMRGKIDFV